MNAKKKKKKSKPMTSAQARALIDATKRHDYEIAEELGIPERTLRKFLSGDLKINRRTAIAIRCLCEHQHLLNPTPTEGTDIEALWPLKSIKGLPAWRRTLAMTTEPTGIWGGKEPIPAIGAELMVNIHNLGAATVLGYHRSDSGNVGLIVRFRDPPAWYLKQTKKADIPGLVYGSEL